MTSTAASLRALCASAFILHLARADEITRFTTDNLGETWRIYADSKGRVTLVDSVSESAIAQNDFRTYRLSFPRESATEVAALFTKFQHWSDTATRAGIKAAQKELGRAGETALTFHVSTSEHGTFCTLHMQPSQDRQQIALADAREFLKLLAQLPAIDADLAKSKAATAQLK